MPALNHPQLQVCVAFFLSPQNSDPSFTTDFFLKESFSFLVVEEGKLLQQIQWNLRITDTLGPYKFVLSTEVSLINTEVTEPRGMAAAVQSTCK